MVDHRLPAPAKIRRRRYHVFLQVSDHLNQSGMITATLSRNVRISLFFSYRINPLSFQRKRYFNVVHFNKLATLIKF